MKLTEITTSAVEMTHEEMKNLKDGGMIEGKKIIDLFYSGIGYATDLILKGEKTPRVIVIKDPPPRKFNHNLYL